MLSLYFLFSPLQPKKPSLAVSIFPYFLLDPGKEGEERIGPQNAIPIKTDFFRKLTYPGSGLSYLTMMHSCWCLKMAGTPEITRWYFKFCLFVSQVQSFLCWIEANKETLISPGPDSFYTCICSEKHLA